jgi:hypothetical protein
MLLIAQWEDVRSFEIVPVTASTQTQAVMGRRDSG